MNFTQIRMLQFSDTLKKTKMYCSNYEKILPTKSFVFLDPPYVLTYINTYYQEHHMILDDIYNYFIKLHNNKNKILLTLNYDESIKQKFKKFNIKTYKKLARHKEGSKKGILKELIITNY